MNELRLLTLGRVRVLRHEQDITAQLPAKMTALLVYLARLQQPRPREHLAELFWPERGAQQAFGSLRMALSKARPMLGEALQGDHVGLEVHAWLDANAFEEAAKRADEAALHLYEGDFMASFFLRDAHDFEAWQYRTQESLHETFVQASLRCAQAQALPQAILMLQRALNFAPSREELHSALIDLYQRSGSRAAALRQYEACRRLLWEEYGLEPSAATQALLDQPPAPDLPTLSLDPIGESRLPHRFASFVGRDESLRQAESLLLAHPLLTVVATGGAGKTRLALELAYRLADRFAHGVRFVDLSEARQPQQVLQALALALNIDPEDEQLIERITAYLSPRAMLLVLDNFEQVLSAAPLLHEWLKRAPLLRCLVTSRQALKLYGEQLVYLPPLTLQESIQLFVDRLRLIHHDFQRNSANDALIRAVCEQLDGLPLALELAAGRAYHLSLPEILEGLQQPLVLLTADFHDWPQRQRTLFHAIDWSYRLLNEQEARLFRYLSVFRGGWTRSVVPHLSAPEERLFGLVDKSLVRRAFFGTQRYTMLDTIRQYAHEQLLHHGELDEAQQAHAQWVVHLSERLLHDFLGESHMQALARLRDEDENIRAALNYLATQPDQAERSARILSNLGWPWHIQQVASLSFEHGQRLIEQGALLDAPLRARLLLAIGHSADALGQEGLAEAWQREALHLFTTLGDEQQAHYARFALSARLDDEPQVIGELRQIRAYALSIQDDFLLTLVNINLAASLCRCGEYSASHQALQEGMAICTKRQRHSLTVVYSINLAEVLALEGDTATAFRLLEQALAMSQDNQQGFLQAHVFFELIELCYSLRRMDDLWTYLRQASRISEDFALPHLVVRLNFWRAVLAFDAGDQAAFEQALGQVFEVIYQKSTNTLTYKLSMMAFLAYALALRQDTDHSLALLGGLESYQRANAIIYKPFQEDWLKVARAIVGHHDTALSPPSAEGDLLDDLLHKIQAHLQRLRLS